MNKIININSNIEYSEAIYNIENSCFPEDSWSLDSIRSSILNQHSLIFVCIIDDEVVGFINLYNICGEAELNRIAVLKEFRRHNIAVSLLKTAIEHLLSEGCSKIILEVRSLNAAAINLYKKLGFTVDGVRKKYYQNPSDDAVLMSVNI